MNWCVVCPFCLNVDSKALNVVSKGFARLLLLLLCVVWCVDWLSCVPCRCCVFMVACVGGPVPFVVQSCSCVCVCIHARVCGVCMHARVGGVDICFGSV